MLRLALSLFFGSGLCAAVTAYSAAPGAQPSQYYTVTADGEKLFVQKYGDVSFVRFSFSGPVEIRISVTGPIQTYQLSPKSLRLEPSVAGNSLTFSLTEPRKLVLRNVNSIPEALFLFAESEETDAPPETGPDIVNLVKAGVDNTGRSEAAVGIQRAIDRLSGGGTVYVPSGLYRISSSLLLKSNVTLYLAPGAVLQVPTSVKCCFRNQAVISIMDATGARIAGRGVIDGNGSNTSESASSFHMIYTDNVDRCSIEGILILDPGITGIRLVDARDCTVSNVRILAANPRGLSDGIDFDSSRQIVVDDAFLYSSDDSTSQGGGTGIRKTVKDQSDLTIQNSVIYQARSGSAFKIGTTDPQSYIGRITYRNIDIVTCVQVAAFYPTQGANIDSILLESVRVEEVRDRPFEFMIVIPTWEQWNGRLGSIHNVVLRNVSLDNPGRRPSQFTGHSPTSDIAGVRFEHFSIEGRPVTDAAAARVDVSGPVGRLHFKP